MTPASCNLFLRTLAATVLLLVDASVFAMPASAKIADVSITKTGTASAAPGDSVVYTVTVTNDGPNPTTRVVVSDPTPAGLTFVSNTGACATTYPCSIGGLAKGASRTITSTYLLPAGSTSTSAITNTASVTHKVPDPNSANNTASATTTITQADLAITRSGPASATPGGSLVLTTTVTNHGPSSASAVIVASETPDGVTFVSNSDACTTAYPCSLGTMALGATRTITTTYSLPASYGTPDPVLTSATVSGSVVDATSANNTASTSTPVSASADLAITSAGPASVIPGQTATYTVTVTNNGVSDASSVSVAAATPAGLAFSSNTGDCTGTYPCSLGTVPAGSSRTITSTYSIASLLTATPLLHTATVSSATADPVGDNNTATATSTVTPRADLSVTNIGPGGATPGNSVFYSITVTNNGPSDAAAVSVTNPAPAGLSFLSNSGACTGAFPCSLGSLAAGASRTITTTFMIPSSYTTPDPITDTATVSSATTDPVSSNNAATASTAITSVVADLAVTLSGPATATPGGSISYTTTVTNAGPSDATSTVVHDSTPPGLALVSTSTGCTSYPCSLDTVAAGSSRTITTVYSVPSSYVTPDPIVNTAHASSAAADPTPADDSSTVSTPVAASSDLSITKSAPASVTAGNQYVSTITVTNNGLSDARGVNVANATPAGVTFVSNSGACAGAFPCSLATVPTGQTRTITTTWRVPASWSGAGPIVDSASVSSSTTDPVAGNNTATSSTSISLSADLAIATSAPTTVTAGNNIVYTVTITNNGASDASGVSVAAATPTGLSFVSNSGACVSSYPCALGTLASGSSRTITSTYLVPSSYTSPASIAFAAAVSSSTADPAAGNNTSASTTSMIRRADLSIHQVVPGGVTPGTTLVLTVSVTNGGASDADAVTVASTTPTGLTFVSNSGSCTTAYPCSLGTLPAGQARTITTTYLVPAAYTTPDPITSTMSVSSTTIDPASANNSDTNYIDVTTTVAELAVAASGPVSATPGTNISYTTTVTNYGPSNASGVLLEAPTPSGLVFVSTSGACTGTYPCLIDTIPLGSSRTVTTMYSVPASYTSPPSIVNTYFVSSYDADPISANNTATVSSSVAASANVSMAMSGPATATPGENIVYTLTIANAGPSDAASVAVSASVPAGLTLVANSGSCSTAFPCAIGTIASGSTRTITSTYLVAPSYRTPDPIVATATATSSTSDPSSGNNTASASTAVVGVCGDGIISFDEQCDGEPCCEPSTCRYAIASTVCRPGSGDMCDPAETCTGSSASCPADFVTAAATICRAPAGICDSAETCTGAAGAACPSDTFHDTATVCRASGGVCDPAESCTGTSTACPSDSKSTVVCRASVGVCDLMESCDGASDACPADAKSTAECRSASGICDIAETCDGIDDSCPADSLAATTAVCRTGSGDVCDPDEFCTGSDASCPDDTVATPTTTCRAAEGVCDVAETCTGNAGATCPADAFAAATAVCRTGSGDICDPDEFCTGDDASCPDDVVTPAGTTCRSANGVCDVAETCSGNTAAACPADGYAAETTVCRTGDGDICDPTETCTGTDASCPADVFVSAGTACPADGNPCTDDVCNGNGACGTFNADPCDDSSVCTTGDTCTGGACVGLPIDCSDEDLCSQDTCDPVEGCSSAYEPARDCFAASTATLAIRSSETSPGKNRLGFRLTTRDIVPVAALGNPTRTTDYGLCFYDVDASQENSFVGSIEVFSGKGWTTGQHVMTYKDKTYASNGVREMTAGSTYPNRPTSRVRFKGKGANLPLPQIVGLDGSYFAVDSMVVVQVANGTGACWSVDYSSANFIKNSQPAVKAKK